MCGISGLVSKNGAPVNSDLIASINNVAMHRGPDAEQYFFEKNIALGHRRLSIIDLKEASNQPMTRSYKESGSLTIIYNGEIFNYVELRHELINKGYYFSTASDTEVILAAYYEYGEKCVHLFNGMWAFCLYDAQKNHLFCSRDRYGIKPFYFINNDKYFAFASEIKQLRLLLPENKANQQVIAEYLLGFEEYHSGTFFRDIEKLSPGFNLIYKLDNNKVQIDRYYEIHKQILNNNTLELQNEYRELFKDAVNIRLRSDVQVGTCLSGGLDSSAVAAFAAKEHSATSDRPFNAVHAKSFEKSTDESYYAKLVAQFSGINLIIVEPDKNIFSNILDKVIQIQDEPFGGPSIVMQYLVFEAAAQNGITVMLDGQGGDETLIGYDSYFNMYLSSIPIVSQLLDKLKLSKQGLFSLNLGYASAFKNLNSYLKRKLHRSRFNFINPNFFDQINYKLIVDDALMHTKDDFLFQKYNMEHVLEKLLRFEDRNSMAHSIESRLPFLDHRLVEFSLSLPLHLKLCKNESKFILRKSMEGIVPDEVIYRKDKKGFEAPSMFWNLFAQSSDKKIKESALINSLITKQIPQTRDIQWRLANLARWEQNNNILL